jgi:hypothetical protein
MPIDRNRTCWAEQGETGPDKPSLFSEQLAAVQPAEIQAMLF